MEYPMIIHGVFSMSILSRLRSLLGEKEDKEEKSNVEKTQPKKEVKDNVEVTSSNNELNDGIVSGTKTSEPISKLSGAGSDTKQFKKDIDSSEEEIKEPSNEVPKVEVAEPKVDAEETADENIKVSELIEEANEVTQDKASEEEANEVTQDKATEEEVDEETDEIVDEEDSSKSDEKPKIAESEEDIEDEAENEDTINKDEKRDNMTLLTDTELLTSDSLDKDFTAAFIDAGLETVKHCFQCGTCGGTCPSGRRTPYKVRQIVRKCLLGLKEEVISDPALWMCTTCYTCQERCPRSVIIVEIIKKARNIAAHAGYMAEAHKKTGLFVIKTGHGVPINDATKQLRARVGLSELPPTTHAFPEALEEIQKICEITQFDELIGYDKETGELKN